MAFRLCLEMLGEFQTVARVFEEHKIDAIAHFAARLISSNLYRTPLEYYHANTIKTRTLLQATLDHGVNHFIFSVTAAVSSSRMRPLKLST
jgi:UDP-glucose 4-epimerase